MIRILLLLPFLLLPTACGGSGAPAPAPAGGGPAGVDWPAAPTEEALLPPRSRASAILLVRHAERAPEPADDPGLTSTGVERAQALARLLGDAPIHRIYSTRTRRTLETAGPLAEALGLEVEFYDSSDLDGLARELIAQPGSHLVVGHSNTTPDLVRALGGETHGPIVEAWEYDRLYVLTPGTDGSMGTLLLRYGPNVNRP
ncbi:MAG: histidine phosphatase family protein [Gemmatimonadales bacterium]|nr:MAG: histidine phosphatase family protein [Gemmatimonadales bacterium]